MKKLILLLLFIPLVSFGQDDEKKNNSHNEASSQNIEVMPLFSDCKNVIKSKQRKCFQIKMNQHISKHFFYPKYAQKAGLQGKVYVSFIIEKDGTIGEIKARGTHRILENAAIKIIKKLPKFIPGTINGEPASVPFSIPITWRLR